MPALVFEPRHDPVKKRQDGAEACVYTMLWPLKTQWRRRLVSEGKTAACRWHADESILSIPDLRGSDMHIFTPHFLPMGFKMLALSQ